MSAVTFFTGSQRPFELVPKAWSDLSTLLEATQSPTLLHVTADLREETFQGTLTFTPMEVRDWRKVYGSLWVPRTQLKRLSDALNSPNWLPQHDYLAPAKYVTFTFTLETL